MSEELQPGMSFSHAAELVASKLYFGNAADWDRCVNLLTEVFAVLVKGAREEIADDMERVARELREAGRNPTKAKAFIEYAAALRPAQTSDSD